MKNFTQKFIGLLALVFAMSFTVNSQEIGDIYAGGIVFQINEDGTGLVAALEDITEGSNMGEGGTPEGFEWGCYQQTVSGADGLSIGTGYQNTLDIVAQNCQTQNGGITAAQATLNYESEGYSDWYLPSKDELVEMFLTIGQGADNTGGFAEYWYFSSSEYNYSHACVVNFVPNGGAGSAGKDLAGRVRVIRSVTFGEDENTENSYLNLPEGWSMFGYTCIDSVDAMVGFAEISDNIEIVKDEWGLSYLPSWEFNAMGSLQFSEGYQIKMIEEVTDFQFCEAIVPEDGVSQADVDAAVAAVVASYAGYTAPLDLQIGDLHAGGIVFQINENGSGLVAAMEDSGVYHWGQAFTQACSYNSEGYGWYLPSLEELELMYITIGQGSPEGNIGGFANNWYWSSTEYDDNLSLLNDYDLAWLVNFNYNGSSYYSIKTSSRRVRVIRAF